MKKGGIVVIIPAFNEAGVIKETIRGVFSVLPKHSTILVVDDGSTDQTGEIAYRSKAFVVRHPINRGLGGALGTGLCWAKMHGFNYAVTFDADGQHDPFDLKKILKPILSETTDVVIGSRVIHGWSMIPFDRKLIITASNLLTWCLFGIFTTDSLSGLRAFNRKAIRQIQIKTDRMEVSNEFFCEIKRNKLRIKEIPIRVMYTDYSRSKGQKNTNALDVGSKLLLRLFR